MGMIICIDEINDTEHYLITTEPYFILVSAVLMLYLQLHAQLQLKLVHFTTFELYAAVLPCKSASYLLYH